MSSSACRNLPGKLRTQGIIYGTAGAIVLRIILIAFALALLAIPYLKIVGAVLLVWIGVKLFQSEDEDEHAISSSDKLWGAVKTVIVADLVMSVDNVLAIAGAAQGAHQDHQLALVIFGLLVSIPIIVGGSTIIGRLMDRFPVILYAGAGLLGWTAGSMIGHDKILGPMIESSVGAWAPLAIQIFLAVGVIAVGLVLSRSVTAKAQG